MKNILIIIIATAFLLLAETLFEVKDASDHTVLNVSTDGLRIMNYPDTLMVISSNEIKACLDNSKGLSRTFSVTTPASVKGSRDIMEISADSTRFWITDAGSGFGVSSLNSGSKGVQTNVLEVSTSDTKMREGALGKRYTDFSPENMFLGFNSGISITPGTPLPYSGKSNVFIGNNSGRSNTRGFDNVMIGDSAGFSNNMGNWNILIGNRAGKSNTGGSGNIYIGDEAGAEAESGSQNIAIGQSSGRLNQGETNIFIGSGSGSSNLYGETNCFLGYASGEANYNGLQNTYLGNFSGQATEGDNNTFVGCWSGSQKTGGEYNTFVGHYSGSNSASGSRNVFIGDAAGLANTGSDNVFIGHEVGWTSGSASNKLYIDNSNTASPLIYGDFYSNYVKINGSFSAEDITVSNDTPAVYGKHAVTDNYGVGVKGESKWRGVEGITSNASGFGYALFGSASGIGTGTRYGIYATASGGATAWAGYFAGPVHATSFSTTKSEVKIDHPLDPENKFLVHSAVISDKMTNIYNGSIILDSEGKAEVKLPEWFQALNKDFLYQLTAIGKPGPNLYISKEIVNNIFEIAGGSPGMKVSWMITGTRNDYYAKANPVEIEKNKKDDEKGLYLHPDAYGLPEEKGIEYQTQKKGNNASK